MKCPKCNSDMDCKEDTHHYRESGLDYVYLEGIERYTCKCGERVVSIPAIPKLHTVLGRFLIKKNSLLNGKEIRFLRKNMGLTATKLADYIGVDNATISRWENDRHPITKPHDLFLRVVYSNIKDIPAEEIKHIIQDEFKKVKTKSENITHHYISLDQWSKPDRACASA
jgi:putative zinc finger/helix-turn-helix YgiT family protein